MAEAFMAYPALRHPFEKKPVNPDGGVTVLAGGKAIHIEETGSGDGLLVDPARLPELNGFELKPEGACLGEVCIPIKTDSGILVEAGGKTWFNLTAFADLLGQPWVADEDAGVWSFGETPTQRASTLVDGMAPEFEVKDRQGEVIRMSDFKGRKALIVTWSSW